MVNNAGPCECLLDENGAEFEDNNGNAIEILRKESVKYPGMVIEGTIDGTSEDSDDQRAIRISNGEMETVMATISFRPFANILLDKEKAADFQSHSAPKVREVLSRMSLIDVNLKDMRSNLYRSYLFAILDMVRPLMKEFPDGITSRFCFRYIDDDNEQSVYRVKKVKVAGENMNTLLVLMDTNNGDSWPSDIHASEDYDDDFENERWEDFNIDHPTILDVDFIHQLYIELHDYTLVRLALENIS